MKLQIDKDGWVLCRIHHMGYGQNHYIRLATDQTTITVYGNRQELTKVLDRLLLAVNPPMDGLRHSVDIVTQITPADVIDYFRNSPILANLADDVEAVLKPFVISGQSDIDLIRSKLDVSRLIEHGQPIRGAQAAIASALEIPNAGSYRKRILTVLEQLTNSTTTPETARSGQKAA